MIAEEMSEGLRKGSSRRQQKQLNKEGDTREGISRHESKPTNHNQQPRHKAPQS